MQRISRVGVKNWHAAGGSNSSFFSSWLFADRHLLVTAKGHTLLDSHYNMSVVKTVSNSLGFLNMFMR